MNLCLSSITKSFTSIRFSLFYDYLSDTYSAGAALASDISEPETASSAL